MQVRYVLGAAGVVGAGAVILTQLGQTSSDRQYKKTLAYMHDGRDKFAKKMEDAQTSAKEVLVGKK